MKRIRKCFYTILFVVICSNLSIISVHASEQKSYKSETKNNIIYIIEKNDAFEYSWQFNKNEYRDGINFSLKIDNNSPEKKDINKYLYDNTKVKYLSFEHHGALPTTALMKVRVNDKFSDGDKLYLYYFNNETNKLEYIDSNLLVKNGSVEFEIEHCSDYILTASIVRTAVDNPQSMSVVIIALIGLGFVLIAATLFMNSKK